MSHSPAAQLAQGTGSGRRTTPTTRSPGAKWLPAGALATRPRFSWPMMRRSRPGGALPYAPLRISPSVPQTPMLTPSTSSVPGSSGGSGRSSRRALSATPGIVVIARMADYSYTRQRVALVIGRSLNNAMGRIAARRRWISARAAAIGATAAVAVAVLAPAGCQRLASRVSEGETAPPPAPPVEPGAAPALQPGATMTPKTEAPNEARVLSSAFSAAARALGPSVVRIDVEIPARVAENEGQGEGDDGEDPEMAPFLRRFFQFGPGTPEPAPGPQQGTGSGVVMDARGDIVTNRHVVSGATNVMVTFSDGREFTAKTLGMDSETDVAVIRLDKPPRDLVAARLGDDDQLEVGEWVLAIGSPLGLDQTVTAGIVSGKGKVGRHVQMSGGRVRHYIQTDAKINPGNSGGPLVNLSSEVVGINTLINTGPGGAYGFAIPINQVRRVAESLLKEGRVRYAYLGVLVGDLSEVDAVAAKGAPSGTSAFVSEVTPGGPAARAGLHPGDFI